LSDWREYRTSGEWRDYRSDKSLIQKGDYALMLCVGEAKSLAHKTNLSPPPLTRQIGK
jgi:hypothetical protein